MAKGYIFTALMLIMEKKCFNDISITEITEKAGVSRMAYYRNYTAKEEIITKYLDELFEDYLQEITSGEEVSLYRVAHQYFIYFRKHEKLILNLIKSNLSNLILERFNFYMPSVFEKVLKKYSSPHSDKYELFFISGGLYNVLVEWVKHGLEETDEEMADLICTFAKF
jgi:AcrR family transcriptional regulator